MSSAQALTSIGFAGGRRRPWAVGLAAVLLGVTGVSTSAAGPAQAAGPEQVTNGDFSDGLTGWNNYPAPTVTDGAHPTMIEFEWNNGIDR